MLMDKAWTFFVGGKGYICLPVLCQPGLVGAGLVFF